MMIGPEPMTMIFLISLRFGILVSQWLSGLARQRRFSTVRRLVSQFRSEIAAVRSACIRSAARRQAPAKSSGAQPGSFARRTSGCGTH